MKEEDIPIKKKHTYKLFFKRKKEEKLKRPSISDGECSDLEMANTVI